MQTEPHLKFRLPMKLTPKHVSRCFARYGCGWKFSVGGCSFACVLCFCHLGQSNRSGETVIKISSHGKYQ
ncbi:CLUMA_CG008245, isoform A [Clunio marinus]|uniref:CLUMA_CG008245, isoform A n=1 Tax=Clunio marinus TaxID=568069 RepID=A0A1J1I8J9_9DIPT|nr:CLUMA_CG008245, isoform A [Clunio marinus]